MLQNNDTKSLYDKKMLKSSSSLFTPIKINQTIIRNRFMRSATYEALSDNETGLPSDKLKHMITKLSEGEVGLIVPGYVYPIYHGKAAKNQTSMCDYSQAETWKSVINSIHSNGSKIIFQVCHGGIMCNSDDILGHEPIGCSPVSTVNGRSMTEGEIEETIDSFVRCAKNLRKIGSDGIQIHCAHGYLYSHFLSPTLNRRADKWGGSFENRIRIVYETAKEIRRAVGNDFIVSVKMNSCDYIENGVTPDLCAKYIRELRDFVDLFELSGGMRGGQIIRCKIDNDLIKRKINKNDLNDFLVFANNYCSGVVYENGYHSQNARIVRKLVPGDVKLAVVGGNRKFNDMQKLIDDGIVDLASLSRPFLREPLLVKDIRTGKIDDIGCNSCGMCTMNRKNGIKCQNY